MTAPHGQGPPRSTLADLMASVVARYDAIGAKRSQANPGGVELLVGERYLRQDGAPPRLVMVRTTGRIVGPPRGVGAGLADAGVAQGVTCYLWGAEATDDLQRYAAQDTLVDRFVSVLRAIAPGRCEISTLNPLVATNVLTFGEELQILVTWTRSVPRDAAVRRAAVTPAPPVDPMRPNGDTGNNYTFDPTVERG